MTFEVTVTPDWWSSKYIATLAQDVVVPMHGKLAVASESLFMKTLSINLLPCQVKSRPAWNVPASHASNSVRFTRFASIR